MIFLAFEVLMATISFPTTQQSVDDLENYIVNMRKETTSPPKYSEVMSSKEFEEVLPKISGENLLSCIEQLAHKILGNNNVLIELFPFSGHSGNQIYSVKEDDQIRCLVKVFPEKSHEFLDEFFSLKVYSDSPFKNCPQPFAVATGYFKENGVDKHANLLAEQMISGETLKQKLEKLFNSPSTSLERGNELNHLKEMFFSFGKAFAAFHNTEEENKELTLDPFVDNYFEELTNIAFKKLQKSDAEIQDFFLDKTAFNDMDQFIDFLKLQVEKTKNLLTPNSLLKKSYIHADPSFGNIICDDKNEIIFLDTWWGAFAIDANKKPRGIPFFDFVQVERRLWYLFNDEKLSKEEYNLLTKEFRRGYKENGGLCPAFEEQEYYAFMDAFLLFNGIIQYFHVGAKDSLGHLIKYWMNWMSEKSEENSSALGF